MLSGSLGGTTTDQDIITRLIAGTLPDPDGQGFDVLAVPTKQVLIADIEVRPGGLGALHLDDATDGVAPEQRALRAAHHLEAL